MHRCPQLAATRTTVVFGAGNADADLMFVGEAPGANEDRQGLPFVGQAGKLLDKLLGEIGLAREDVFIANVLKCRPARQPRSRCRRRSRTARTTCSRQLELIEPTVVCTLGNFATKLLRGDPTGITRLHGREEVRVIGPRAVRLYPLFHPAAALYTPSNVEIAARGLRAHPRAAGARRARAARAGGRAGAGGAAGAGAGAGARSRSSPRPRLGPRPGPWVRRRRTHARARSRAPARGDVADPAATPEPEGAPSPPAGQLGLF